MGKTFWAALTLSTGLCAGAQAAVVTFELAGKVSEMGATTGIALFDTTISIGTGYRMRFTFDDGAADIGATANSALYPGLSAELLVDGFGPLSTLSPPLTSSAVVRATLSNDVGGLPLIGLPGVDRLSISAEDLSDPQLPSFGLDFSDGYGIALPSTSLLDLLSLPAESHVARFSNREAYLRLSGLGVPGLYGQCTLLFASSYCYVRMTVDSIEVRPAEVVVEPPPGTVPLPSTLWLTFAGMAALGAAAARRQRAA